MVLLLVVIQLVTSKIKLRFEGDIAQASSITYQQGAVLLDDTQVGLMVRDPEKYLRDYKNGTSSRRPYFDTTQNSCRVSFANYHFQAAQVWLMGDGDYDNVFLVVTDMTGCSEIL